MNKFAQWAVTGLAFLGTGTAMAASVLFGPAVVDSSIVGTGIEARLQFSPNTYDSSLSGRFNLGDVGVTANITNDPAFLLNTVYTFNLRFVAATDRLVWTVTGGALAVPNVLRSTEPDSFNSIRLNFRTLDPAHTIFWSDVAFTAKNLTTQGSLIKSGSVSNAVAFQRIVSAPGQPLLSSFDWTIRGKVSTNGIAGSQTKMWVASHNLQLAPTVTAAGALAPSPVSVVPEPAAAGMMALGLLGIGWAATRRRRRG